MLQLHSIEPLAEQLKGLSTEIHRFYKRREMGRACSVPSSGKKAKLLHVIKLMEKFYFSYTVASVHLLHCWLIVSV